MQFRAEPYKLIIKEADEHIIETCNGNGVFKSIELDKLTEEADKIMTDYSAIVAEYQSKEKYISHKQFSELTSEELALLARLQDVKKNLHLMIYNYTLATIKNYEKHRDILDSIESHDIGNYISMLRVAVMGGTYNTVDTGKMTPEEVVKKKRSSKQRDKTKKS